ncbi:MAG TPA: HD domain-containing protein, partial [Soehngenia sp.]|nr:HD domain-containing protein [Soehngenia sp.]
DLVEIYAGDTFCYDKIANGDKKDREEIAAEKIFGLLEEDKGREFKSLWEEFEAMETPEARFSASMDRLQPMLNNYNNAGGTWKEYNVSKEDIYKRIEPVKHSSKELWDFVLYMLEDAQKKGYIVKA